ncbi:hypothetical protein PO909_009229 [Leuciscus waleckii]
MKFQMLLLAFALVIATNIHCQAQPQLRDSDKSPEVKGHVMSRRQVRTCNCSGRRISVEQNCPCAQRLLSKEQRALCQKKGIASFKKCQQLNGGIRKQKKGNISMPI